MHNTFPRNINFSKIELNPKDKIIKNKWHSIDTAEGHNVEVSPVLDTNAVEGLTINRYRSMSKGLLSLNNGEGHLFSLIKGEAKLNVNSEPKPLYISSGNHLYVPPGASAVLHLSANVLAIHVSGPQKQAVGKKLIVRNERFARAARDVLTPQYLSRRIFTNRDKTLLSKYGTQVAWFHTTMFDSTDLPKNAQGDGVFKMSYDHQTEPNVVYEIGGKASVRFANHPYESDSNAQTWSDWFFLDSETTYYLNEAPDGKELEQYVDPITQEIHTLRNRHEVRIQPGDNGEQGYVSLCCLFDPGPSGLEQHQPGEYSSYTPVTKILGTPKYNTFLKEMEPIDDMIDVLSLAVARGVLEESLDKLPQWKIYETQKATQIEKQQTVIDQLSTVDNGRDKIVSHWRLV